MKRKHFIKSAAAALLTAGTLVSGAVKAEGNYILATASTGGTYYPVGVALATLTKVKLEPKQKIGMSAISSAGSGENVKLLRDGEAQFAIMQGLYGSYAWNGTGPIESDGPQQNLRSVTMLWQNVEHFLLRTEFVNDGSIGDLLAQSGSKMGFGKENSGTIGSNRRILANLGADMDADFDLYHGGYGPTAEQLQNGQIAGAGIPAGVPVGAITQLMAGNSDDVALLNFSPDQQAKADAGLELWTPYLIPAGTYPGQENDVNTIAQPNFLATDARVSEEHVYQITKTIYENLSFLQGIHAATKAMAIEKALPGLPAPLHPGALRFYREVGVDVPARLVLE
ncbi:TAXI family TRAP transporter solute-binding subunit [Gammaproteobacteria bacterium]|nr:TAXI family TRAP transporter solute-binding subunit [Gammaproteobacteria bacterium]